jgi:SulP family sulfate permease
LVLGLGIETKTVADIASISGGFPFHIPDITLSSKPCNFPYALIMASVGLTEGLLTINLVDEITGTRGNGNRECIAQEVPIF